MRLVYQLGSIPASAGEPKRREKRDGEDEVYPRECGGTLFGWLMDGDSIGLSPRVRGNLDGQGSESIPPKPVYPRECGGTVAGAFSRGCTQGSIPASAGEPPHAHSGPMPRSIPASAGEPTHCRKPLGLTTVYPRECGGTIGSPHGGLSPRVRGNRRSPGVRVYPRECGGTIRVMV